MRVGLIKKEITTKNWSSETSLVEEAEPKSSLRFLVENPVTYSQLDSCFGNIFLCKKRELERCTESTLPRAE